MASRHPRLRSSPKRPSSVLVRRRKPHVRVSPPSVPATNAQLQHNRGAPHTHPRLQQPQPTQRPFGARRHPRPVQLLAPERVPAKAATSPRSSRTSSRRTTSCSNGQQRPPREPTHRGTSSTTAATIVGQPACRTIRPTITLRNDPVSTTPDSQQPVGQPDRVFTDTGCAANNKQATQLPTHPTPSSCPTNIATFAVRHRRATRQPVPLLPLLPQRR